MGLLRWNAYGLAIAIRRCQMLFSLNHLPSHFAQKLAIFNGSGDLWLRCDCPIDPSWQNPGNFDTARVMAVITLLVTSIDPLAPYKASDDLLLELVSVVATVHEDPDGASAAASRVEILEPINLAKHQPPGGYILDNRHLQLTCAKNAEVRLGQEIIVKANPTEAVV